MEDHGVNLARIIQSKREENLEKAIALAHTIQSAINFEEFVLEAVSKNKQSARIKFADLNLDLPILRPSEIIIAGEQLWADVITHLVKIVESLGISCKCYKATNKNYYDDDHYYCPECLNFVSPDGDGDTNCCLDNNHRKASSVIAGLVLSWE
jgi:hypothetical protein